MPHIAHLLFLRICLIFSFYLGSKVFFCRSNNGSKTCLSHPLIHFCRLVVMVIPSLAFFSSVMSSRLPWLLFFFSCPFNLSIIFVFTLFYRNNYLVSVCSTCRIIEVPCSHKEKSLGNIRVLNVQPRL